MMKQTTAALLRRLRFSSKAESAKILIADKAVIAPVLSADVSSIVSDRKIFDDTIYTPLEVAWEELLQRRQDVELVKKVEDFLCGDVPEPLKDHPAAVLFRNLVTPNYEVRRFVSLINGYGKLRPLAFEYTADKFTSNNELKRMLGKMYFAHSLGRKGGMNLDSINVIDFVASDGKPIKDVKTTWGQSLVDFHHDFLKHCYPEMLLELFDASKWLKGKGKRAIDYYSPFFTLFIVHGILFENMMLDEKELAFAKNVFVPAFLSVWKEFGVKPLIVALEPTDIEGDKFWMCYPSADMSYVQSKML